MKKERSESGGKEVNEGRKEVSELRLLEDGGIGKKMRRSIRWVKDVASQRETPSREGDANEMEIKRITKRLEVGDRSMTKEGRGQGFGKEREREREESLGSRQEVEVREY